MLHRGASCTVDLSEDYERFVDKDRPLGEVPARLQIPPLRAALPAAVGAGVQ
ncbi:MAG TPA: hypothetical protein VI197_03085 [Polyangiaceae bacterium]